MPGLFAVIIALLVAVDQLIKVIMELWLKPQGVAWTLKGFLQLDYAENRGAAFSMLSGETGRWIFISFTSVVIVVGFYLLMSGKLKKAVPKFCAVLILAGGIGNLIDRIFRGIVIDYIEPLFVDFAIFNFADCLVTVGAIVLVIYLIWDIVKDGKKSGKGKR